MRVFRLPSTVWKAAGNTTTGVAGCITRSLTQSRVMTSKGSMAA